MSSVFKTDIKKTIADSLLAQKISPEQSSQLNALIESMSLLNYKEINYTDFDKENSNGIIFSDNDRVAGYAIAAPVKYGNTVEESIFTADPINTLTTTRTEISNVVIKSQDGLTMYTETTDYTFDSTTGVITRITAALGGNITDAEAVSISYFSSENVTPGTATLQTKVINIGASMIKAIKLNAVDENVELQLSKDGISYFNVPSYNIFEEILETEELYIRVIVPAGNSIRNIIVSYEKIIK